MIGKAKSNKSLQAKIAYNEKEKATLVYANKLVGMSLSDANGRSPKILSGLWKEIDNPR